MAMQQGYSTTNSSCFDGNSFAYWKGKMRYYLVMDIEMWFVIKDYFEMLVREPLEFVKWSNNMERIVHANDKATLTLQCGLIKVQLDKVGFNISKEL